MMSSSGQRNTDKNRRQSLQATRAIPKNSERRRIGVVVPHIHHDIEASPGTRSNRFVESDEQQPYLGLQIRPFAAGSQAYPRQQM